MHHSPNFIRRILLSAFSRGSGTIRKHVQTNPLGRQIELLEDRVVPAFPGTATTVTALTTGFTAANNNYTIINNAIQAAASGDTIILNGTFTWTETNAKNSWTLGSDGKASFTVGSVPGTGDPTDDADNYSIFVPPGLNNVTLTALTPTTTISPSTGAATVKYNGIIKGPNDLSTVDNEGVLYFDGGGPGTNQGWTISNLDIENFDVAIGMYQNGGPTNAYNNTTITNNKILVPKDLIVAADPGDNVGIYLGYGTGQTVSNNTILIAGNGTSDPVNSNYAQSVGIETQAAGGALYDGLDIVGNTIQVTGAQTTKPEIVIGVWDNSGASNSNINISNNTFTNATATNVATNVGKQAVNLERGFRITSHSSASTTVTYANNIVNGANVGFQWLPSSYGADYSGLLPVQLIGNTITSTFTGVLIQSHGSANMIQNTITAGGTVIAADKVTKSVGVDVQTGSLTGATQNIISGNNTGILIESPAGTIGSITNNNIAGNTSFNLANGLNRIAASATGAKEVGTTVTITTTTPHALSIGSSVTISGVAVGGYNGVVTVTSVPDNTHFTYSAVSGLAASGGGVVLDNARPSVTATNNWWGAVGSVLGVLGPVDSSSPLNSATQVLPLTTFDFEKVATDPTQGGAIGVLPTTAYTTSLGYGWTPGPAPATSAAPVGNDKLSLAMLAANPQSYMLQDGVSNTVAGVAGSKTFRVDLTSNNPVQITAFLGKGTLAYTGVTVEFSTDGTNFTPFVSNLAIAKNVFPTVSTATLFPAGITPTNNKIYVRFQGLNGWAVAGINVVPVASLGTLAIAPPGGPLQTSSQVDTFTVTGATPGALLSVSVTAGTIVTADAALGIAGVQVVADQTGSATFQVRRPFFTSASPPTITSTISVSDYVGGATAASIPQVYTPAATGSVLKFDMNFNSTTVPATLPDSSWTDVKNNSLYGTGATGFGWGAAVTGKDLSTNFPPSASDEFNQDLYRDYNSSTSATPQTFKVFVGANQNATVRVYAFTTVASPSPTGMKVQASGGVQSAAYLAGQTFVDVTGTGDATTGILTITLTKGTNAWVVNGMQVTLT